MELITTTRRPLTVAAPPRLDLARAWRYQSAGARERRLDLLRGCLVAAMLADHMGGSSWLYAITGGNRFYVSAAEGFVLISGIVMGLVYARLIARDGLWAVTRRILRRAAWLYLVWVGLSISFRVASERLGANWSGPAGDLGAYALNVVMMRESYYLADVLLLYALLVAAAPLALLLLARRRTTWLLAGSWGVWGLYQAGLTAPIDAWFGGALPVFPPLAWQMIFGTGLVIGFHWQRVRGWLEQARWQWLATPGLMLLAGGLILLSMLAPASSMADAVAAFFEKSTLGPGRLLATAVFLPLLFGLMTALWQPLTRGLGWLLLPLGERALLAYACHLYLVLLATVGLPAIPFYRPDDALSNTLAQLGAILALWIVVMAQPRLRRHGRRLIAAPLPLLQRLVAASRARLSWEPQ